MGNLGAAFAVYKIEGDRLILAERDVARDDRAVRRN
jgi:hypothetical protein